MQQGPVQVTVVEYVNEFFKNYSRRAYGKTLQVNANKGAETLMGEFCSGVWGIRTLSRDLLLIDDPFTNK
jgi:hypothetical protein